MTVIGKYRIIAELGRGGMGIVYKAEDLDLGRTVALKILSPSTDLTPDQHREYSRRFEVEAKATAALHHPNIVTLFDRGEVDGVRYLAMAYVDGQTLDAILRTKRILTVEETVSLLKPIAQALDYAHGNNVIHRDIKPSNIMVQHSDGRPLLADFGIAKATLIDSRQSTVVLGTAAYMAPEQLRFEPPTAAVDQWALAVVAFQLLTGRLPFPQTGDALFYAILNLPPAWPDDKPSTPLRASREPIVRALSKDPRDRFASCAEFISALGEDPPEAVAEK
jgi:serine/threonine-protein kinase